MSKAQERNNRRQGQRIRRLDENLDALIGTQERTTEKVSELDRDMKMLKARVTALESERARRS